MYSHTVTYTHTHSHTPHIPHPHPLNHTLIYPDLTSWSLSSLPQGTLGFCSQGEKEKSQKEKSNLPLLPPTFIPGLVDLDEPSHPSDGILFTRICHRGLSSGAKALGEWLLLE